MGLLSVAISIFFVRVSSVDAHSFENFRCPRVDIWVSLNETIYRAYDFMHSGLHDEARSALTSVFMELETNLTGMFDCSIGVAAYYRALAHAYMVNNTGPESTFIRNRSEQVSLRLLHVAMNWLTYAFVLNARNDGTWVDESQWPITIQSINDEESMLQRSIFARGNYGNRPLRAVPADFRNSTLRIGIVSVCDYPESNPLPRLSRSNREIYAKRHGYVMIEANHRSDESRPHAWSKITLLLDHIMSPDLDWLLWFDCDTFFMDLNVTLDSLLYQYGGSPNDSGIDPSFNMLVQEDHAMINTGVFFIRTGEWSRQLLNRVYGTPESPWINHPWWENAAFSHEFLGDLPVRVSELTASQDAADEIRGIYPAGVRVVYQSLFNSYHPITSRLFMHDTWEVGKFVLAFSGCKSGSSDAVVRELYMNYYRLMCEINNVKSLCI